MSDRISTIIVVLEKDIRDDDCEAILKAMGMIRGVLSVTPNVANVVEHMAQTRARAELTCKLLELVRPQE